jgi:hypothetical protein
MAYAQDTGLEIETNINEDEEVYWGLKVGDSTDLLKKKYIGWDYGDRIVYFGHRKEIIIYTENNIITEIK